MKKPSEITKAVIGERFLKIDQATQELEEILSSSNIEKFKNNRTLQYATIYALVLGIEAICDIGNHILSYFFGRKSDTYKDIVRQLSEVNVVPKNLVDESIKMVDFRNIAIHIYLKVDVEKIYKDLPLSIKHFKEYARYFLKFIEEKK